MYKLHWANPHFSVSSTLLTRKPYQAERMNRTLPPTEEQPDLPSFSKISSPITSQKPHKKLKLAQKKKCPLENGDTFSLFFSALAWETRSLWCTRISDLQILSTP